MGSAILGLDATCIHAVTAGHSGEELFPAASQGSPLRRREPLPRRRACLFPSGGAAQNAIPHAMARLHLDIARRRLPRSREEAEGKQVNEVFRAKLVGHGKVEGRSRPDGLEPRRASPGRGSPALGPRCSAGGLPTKGDGGTHRQSSRSGFSGAMSGARTSRNANARDGLHELFRPTARRSHQARSHSARELEGTQEGGGR